MKVTIDVVQGNYPYEKPTKKGIQKNIDALDRAIDGKPIGCDFQYYIDTKYLLKAIQEQLPSKLRMT